MDDCWRAHPGVASGDAESTTFDIFINANFMGGGAPLVLP
jgi:hypothetical protein